MAVLSHGALLYDTIFVCTRMHADMPWLPKRMPLPLQFNAACMMVIGVGITCCKIGATSTENISASLERPLCSCQLYTVAECWYAEVVFFPLGCALCSPMRPGEAVRGACWDK